MRSARLAAAVVVAVALASSPTAVPVVTAASTATTAPPTAGTDPATVPPGTSAAPAHGHHHADTANGQPDRVITGPQGGRGQFVVECPFSHEAPDDPIVLPGQPGAAHLHEFFGNRTTNAASTLASLDAGGTTCDQQLDRAAYWAPALYDGDRLVAAVKSTAYYRAGLDVDPTTVQPFPPGLTMIAGNAAATAAQPVAVVAWTCGASGERLAAPPTCRPERKLRMILTFPDCWNGRDLDAADHRSHVAYSHLGQCPADRPVAIPQLQFSVEYSFSGDPTSLRLASGTVFSGHADFVNAWDPVKLQTEVNLCIRRDTVCGITSGRKTG